MSSKQVVVCDSCGQESALTSITSPWYHVNTVVATQEMAQSLMERLTEDQKERGDFKDAFDFGDFCSLVCLANWASVRANLRGLDAADPVS